MIILVSSFVEMEESFYSSIDCQKENCHRFAKFLSEDGKATCEIHTINQRRINRFKYKSQKLIIPKNEFVFTARTPRFGRCREIVHYDSDINSDIDVDIEEDDFVDRFFNA